VGTKLPEPRIEDIYNFLISKVNDYQLYVGTDGKFYMGEADSDSWMPINHIRCLLRQDLHANYFLTPAKVKRILDAMIKGMQKKAETFKE